MPRCGIAYTHDSDDHRRWIIDLTIDLLELGIDVKLDQAHLGFGADMMHFMEGLIRDSDFVLVIMTENYKRKVDARAGGAGYEGSIISAEMYSSTPDQAKFVPILRSGRGDTAVPTFLEVRKYLDLRPSQDYGKGLEQLRRHLLGLPQVDLPELRAPRRPRIDSDTVYLSFPFDEKSIEIFNAVSFAVLYMGLKPIFALKDIERTSTRLEKITLMIYGAPLAIFMLNGASKSQNIAFELGIRLGAPRSGQAMYGPVLLLENTPYWHQRYISDIAGVDVFAVGHSSEKAIVHTVNYLNHNAKDTQKSVSSREVTSAYGEFNNEAQSIAPDLQAVESELPYLERINLVEDWLASRRKS